MRSTSCTFCMPQLTTVVSEIRPMLSPKHEPPAIAANVSTTLPPTMWFSHRKIGAQAAIVPHDVPVATDSTQVTRNPTTATSLAVSPSDSARLMIAAATPVAMKHSATA